MQALGLAGQPSSGFISLYTQEVLSSPKWGSPFKRVYKYSILMCVYEYIGPILYSKQLGI